MAAQQAALFESIHYTGQRCRRQADPPAECAGRLLPLAGQHLQDHQLHGRQPAETRQAFGVHFGVLLQAPQGLEQAQVEDAPTRDISFTRKLSFTHN